MQVDASVPLFGYIGRLEEQKGVDILCAALPTALQNGNLQVAILGTGTYYNVDFWASLDQNRCARSQY